MVMDLKNFDLGKRLDNCNYINKIKKMIPKAIVYLVGLTCFPSFVA